MRDLVADRLQRQQLEDRVREDDPEGSPPRVVKPAASAGPSQQSRHQTSESGIAALRLAMNSSSASSMPGSIGGASYSRSIRFQTAFARWFASSEPSSCHCSKLLLSAISER